MVSFHSLLGLRTGLSEMGTCRVDSRKRQNSRHLALVAYEGRHEKGKGLDEDPKTCFRVSCRVAFVKLSWLLKPKPNSNASHFRSSLYTDVVLFFFVFFQNIFIFYHVRSVDFKEKIEGL